MVGAEYEMNSSIVRTSTNAVGGLSAADSRERLICVVDLSDVSQFVEIQVSRRTLVVSARPWLFSSTDLRVEKVNPKEKIEQG